MPRMTDVVKNLLIINILLFISVHFLLIDKSWIKFFWLVHPNISYFDPTLNTILKFEPVQIVTHLFMHGDIKHLALNMLGLYFLGPYVESSLGPKRFLILYLSAGFIGSAIQILWTENIILGASGAVYGVLAAFATMFPNIRLMLLFPPIPVKAKYLAMGLIAIGIYNGMSNSSDGIGHFAHIGGALAGFGMIRLWGLQNLR